METKTKEDFEKMTLRDLMNLCEKLNIDVSQCEGK